MEIEEESGLDTARFLSDDIFSLEILTVDGHEKRETYVSSHLHLNITFLLEADPKADITVVQKRKGRAVPDHQSFADAVFKDLRGIQIFFQDPYQLEVSHGRVEFYGVPGGKDLMQPISFS